MREDDGIVLIIVFMMIVIVLLFLVTAWKFRTTGYIFYTPEQPRVLSPENMTLALVSAGEEYMQGDNRQQAFSAALEMSEKRKQALLSLAHEDPRRFLRLALPVQFRERLPLIIQSSIESDSELEGDLTMMLGGSVPLYFLHSQNEDFSVFFDPSLDPLPGHVTIHGVRLERIFVADSITVLEPLAIRPFPKNAAVILFSVGGISRPGESDGVSASLFNTSLLSNLTSHVYGWYTLPHQMCEDIHCTPDVSSSVVTSAEAAAREHGFIHGSYDSIIYLALTNDSCQPAVSCSDQKSVFLEYDSRAALAHQVGNTLGLRDTEGDHYDIMDGGQSLNGFHRYQLGIITGNNIYDISVSGVYTISRLGTNGTQVLRIASDGSYYYLEYRNSGISLYRVSNTGESVMVDDLILPGENFFDSARNVRISVTSLSEEDISVSILFGPSRCVHADPSVSLYPLSQWGNESATYTLTIKNNDIRCSESVFSIDGTLPAGWKQDSPSTIILDSGENTSIHVTITPESLQGFYTFSEHVVNTNVPTLHADSEGGYAFI
ncbi:hypothetical protein KW805_00615 [Candidatus Pacearchaeota archaeon]|nr:hypothetical protein [Candidatus Pacearchaeota archaeon]